MVVQSRCCDEQLLGSLFRPSVKQDDRLRANSARVRSAGSRRAEAMVHRVIQIEDDSLGLIRSEDVAAVIRRWAADDVQCRTADADATIGCSQDERVAIASGGLAPAESRTSGPGRCRQFHQRSSAPVIERSEAPRTGLSRIRAARQLDVTLHDDAMRSRRFDAVACAEPVTHSTTVGRSERSTVERGAGRVDRRDRPERVRRRGRCSGAGEAWGRASGALRPLKTPRITASDPSQLVIRPVAAPNDGRAVRMARDSGSRPRALVRPGPRRSATAVPPWQDRRGDPKAVDLGERGGSVRIRQGPQAVHSRDGGPATPRLHLAFGEVDVESRDLDVSRHLGQQEQVRSQ